MAAIILLFLARFESRAADWPMFRGNPALTGAVAGRLASKLELRWRFKTAGGVKSSPAIGKDRVFIGSCDSNLYALSLADGKGLWTNQTGGEVESSPLLLDDKVFAGSADGILYAWEAATGKPVWKYATGDKILGGPNWVRLNEKGGSRGAGAPRSERPPSGEGRRDEASPTRAGGGSNSPSQLFILVGSYDFKLHCVAAATGRSNWVFETGNYINGSPAVAAGRGVFGGCDALLHVLNLTDGQQEREIDAGAYVPGSVAVAEGHAFFGQYENQVLSVDLGTGKRDWAFHDRNQPYFSSPAVAPDRVVLGGRDKLVHCVRRDTGQALWSFATQGKVDSSPAICDGKVVVGSDDGRLYLLALRTGEELWSYELGQPVESSPAVAGERVVVGCADGVVYCFGEAKKVP